MLMENGFGTKYCAKLSHAAFFGFLPLDHI
jgi:hypothetical protein